MRLIDADALWDELTEDLEDGDVLYRIPPSYIDDAPTVDAVPVVRCRECEHAERYERTDGTAGYSCGHPQNTFVFGDRWDRVFEPIKEPDDFCSYGERRTNQSADVRNMGQFAGDGKTNGGSNERP